MDSNLQSFSSTLNLIWIWTYRIIRARYRQSVLGGLWAILQPVASVAVFSVVFILFVPVDTGDIPYPLFAYAAMVPWTFFVASVSDMAESLVTNMSLVSKIYFPREVLPIAAVFARMLDFLIACGLLVILLIYYRISFFSERLLLFPVILIIQITFALGLGLFSSALNVFYRDIRNIITLGLQIWFYATPIIYPISSVPAKFSNLYFLNPMAGIIGAYRSILFEQIFPVEYLLYSAVISIVVFGLGFWFFKRVEFQFADVV